MRPVTSLFQTMLPATAFVGPSTATSPALTPAMVAWRFPASHVSIRSIVASCWGPRVVSILKRPAVSALLIPRRSWRGRRSEKKRNGRISSGFLSRSVVQPVGGRLGIRPWVDSAPGSTGEWPEARSVFRWKLPRLMRIPGLRARDRNPLIGRRAFVCRSRWGLESTMLVVSWRFHYSWG